jgi:hypothetical protein
MLVATLIGIMIAIVVGVNLLPLITETISNVTAEGDLSPAVSSLMNVLPYIFVAVIIIGAVAWMVGSFGGSTEEKEERREKVKAFFKNPREVILRVERASKKWSPYINNLDALLGIKTINDIKAGDEYGLSLNAERELYIHPTYDWYVADKHPDKDIFMVVGLHKEDASLNRVYLLGVSQVNNLPFLVEVPASKLETNCKTCLDWAKENKILTAGV